MDLHVIKHLEKKKLIQKNSLWHKEQCWCKAESRIEMEKGQTLGHPPCFSSEGKNLVVFNMSAAHLLHSVWYVINFCQTLVGLDYIWWPLVKTVHITSKQTEMKVVKNSWMSPKMFVQTEKVGDFLLCKILCPKGIIWARALIKSLLATSCNYARKFPRKSW